MSKSVLVLEENRTIQGLIASALRDSQVTVHREQTPEQFLARAQQLVPDLILMSTADRERKYAVCRQLKKSGKLSQVPILFLSSPREQVGQDNLKKLGVTVEEYEDGVMIEGCEAFTDASLDAYDDHRVAMALHVAATRAKGKVFVGSDANINTSYPEFLEQLRTVSDS